MRLRVALFVCLGLIAASASPASAVLVELRSGQTISYMPLRQEGSTAP
jgi:hypothetical protein